MENIADKIKRITEIESKKLSNDSKYNELKSYLLEMQTQGLIYPKVYNLPPLDTVGRRLFKSLE